MKRSSFRRRPGWKFLLAAGVLLTLLVFAAVRLAPPAIPYKIWLPDVYVDDYRIVDFPGNPRRAPEGEPVPALSSTGEPVLITDHDRLDYSLPSRWFHPLLEWAGIAPPRSASYAATGEVVATESGPWRRWDRIRDER